MAAYEEKIRQNLWTLLGTSPGERIHRYGYFHCMLEIDSMESLNDFDLQKQVKTAHIDSVPKCMQLSNGTYTRALVDNNELEWIELSPDTKDTPRR